MLIELGLGFGDGYVDLMSYASELISRVTEGS